jgi:hypothetical protein
LQPLGTEGEGLPGGPKKYKRVSVSIPMAIGYRMGLGRKFTLGIEYNFRKTFTDYIDDCSGNYYDNAAILMARGPLAAHFADPSLGLIPGQTAAGQQRGNPKDKDSYMSLEVKLGMFIKEKRRKKLTRSKF